MKKTQVGIEFLYFVGVAVTILIIYLILSSNYLAFSSARKDVLTVTNLLEEIRNEINLAGRVEDGYSKQFKIPLTINNEDYSMNIASREITIRFKDGDYSRLLSTDVNPIEFDQGATYKIEKNDGKVEITKVS